MLRSWGFLGNRMLGIGEEGLDIYIHLLIGVLED